jgi:type VI protein secretion system component VasK
VSIENVAVVAVMAAVWWIPTFKALTDLLDREGVRRVLVWKWMALLCIPVYGWIRYYRRGRAELDADRAQQAKRRPPADRRRGS